MTALNAVPNSYCKCAMCRPVGTHAVPAKGKHADTYHEGYDAIQQAWEARYGTTPRHCAEVVA